MVLRQNLFVFSCSLLLSILNRNGFEWFKFVWFVPQSNVEMFHDII